MISEEQRATFRDRGVLRLPGLVPDEVAQAARDAVHRHLQGRGIRCDGRWRPEAFPAVQPYESSLSFVKALKKSRRVAAVVGAEILGVIDALLDEPASAMADHPQLLFTFPNASRWTVPPNVWHLDLPRYGGAAPSGVQIFTFLDSVAPAGGGTLALAGSHRFLNDRGHLKSAQVKKALRREVPYFRDLMGGETEDRLRFLRRAERHGEIELQVVEMYGEPGDVYFMDLRALHTLAPNTASIPRIMLTQRFLVDALRDEVYSLPAAGAVC
ncbi:MAG: phytanoyl-CoA dioxygenase family protein [Thermoanaerobaculia bacterium]|nr:phytanoyl-CoA dioxygenase family protein [Thermoanaerobaculia bacterium]